MKITGKMVREIKDRLAEGNISIAKLAREYGLSWATTAAIINGKKDHVIRDEQTLAELGYKPESIYLVYEMRKYVECFLNDTWIEKSMVISIIGRSEFLKSVVNTYLSKADTMIETRKGTIKFVCTRV